MADDPLPGSFPLLRFQPFKSNVSHATLLSFILIIITCLLCPFDRTLCIYANLGDLLDCADLLLTEYDLCKGLNCEGCTIFLRIFKLCWFIFTNWELKTVKVLRIHVAALCYRIWLWNHLNGIELVSLTKIKCQAGEISSTSVLIIN